MNVLLSDRQVRKKLEEIIMRDHWKIRGMMLGAAAAIVLLTGAAVGSASYRAHQLSMMETEYGSWHVGFLDVNFLFEENQLRNDQVESVVSFDNIGYARLEGGKNPNKPYLFIAGFHEDTYDLLSIKLLSGRLPKSSREVLVPSHLASDGGVELAPGDTLTLTIGLRELGDGLLDQNDPYKPVCEMLSVIEEITYTVVGVYQRPSFERETSPGYTLITAADDSIFVENYSVFVTLAEPNQAVTYAEGAATGQYYILNDRQLPYLKVSDTWSDAEEKA